jgi:hypothetical protein
MHMLAYYHMNILILFLKFETAPVVGVMISMIVSSAVDRESRSGQAKTIKLVFVASPQSVHH